MNVPFARQIASQRYPRLAHGARPLPAVADEVLAMLDPQIAEHADFHDGWGPIRPRCVPLVRQEPRRAPELLVTEVDAERLELVLSQQRHHADPSSLSELRSELDKATLVSPLAVPPDVVTMNSRVLCRGEREHDLCELKLVYPDDLAPNDASLSILSPFGTALLGLARGDLVEAPDLRGGCTRWSIGEVLYQPEREGHFHL